MSRLEVTNIVSPNTTTDIVIKTGNTTGPQVVIAANGQSITLRGNSSANSIFINSSAVFINGSQPVTSNLTVTGYFATSGNVTPSIITSNTTAWTPGIGNVAIVRLQANAAGTASNTALYEAYISGLAGGVNGQIIVLSNIGSQKIQLRNEDSVNETTAANRFSLPNHVWLGGFQSIKIQYDGTLARWRPMNSLLIASDYKSLLTIGFFGGGTTDGGSTKVSTVNKITYSTETRQATFANTLSSSRDGLAGAGNVDKGFLCGGGTPTFVNTADKVTYTTEAIGVVAGAALSQARAALGAAGNVDKGFFVGGLNPTVLATAGRTIYSTETHAAVTGANLSQSRYYPAGAGNADKGFFAGGLTPTLVATTDRTTYSTETTAAVSGANLSAARRNMASAGNSDKGFFAGGLNPAVVATTDRTTYSSETTAAVSGANLSQARSTPAGAGTADKGFIAGGSTSQTSPFGIVATTDRTTYSSETTAAVSGANLSQARNDLGAV